MAKEEVPSHVKTMKAVNDRWDEADIITDTREVDLGKLLHKSLDLIRDEKGRIRYDYFDPEKYGDKYHHLVVDDMIKQAKAAIGEKLGKDHKMSDLELDMSAENTYGLAKREYMTLLAKYGKDFRIRDFKARNDKFIENLRNQLYSHAGDPLKAEHHKAIMKEMTAKNPGLIKSKDMSEFENPLFRDDIANLIRAFYKSNGQLSREQIKATEHISKYVGAEPKIKYMYEPKEKAA